MRSELGDRDDTIDNHRDLNDTSRESARCQRKDITVTPAVPCAVQPLSAPFISGIYSTRITHYLFCSDSMTRSDIPGASLARLNRSTCFCGQDSPRLQGGGNQGYGTGGFTMYDCW